MPQIKPRFDLLHKIHLFRDMYEIDEGGGGGGGGGSNLKPMKRKREIQSEPLHRSGGQAADGTNSGRTRPPQVAERQIQ